MYKKYLDIKNIENYNFEDVKDAIALFDNQEEYFEVIKEKDVLRSNEQLEFLKFKYRGISDRDLVRLTEMLFVSDINELNRLDWDGMLNQRKGFDFVLNEIWIPFIEDISNKAKLFFYTWDSGSVIEVIQQNNLNHIMKPISDQMFLIEYSDILIDGLYDDNQKEKLIDLILFDKYILGFNKDNNNYNFAQEDIENNIVVLLYINHELGNSVLVVNKDISI